MLVPAAASGAAPELAGLRTACRTAITRIAGISDRLVLVGVDDRTFAHSPAAVGSLAGFGVDLRAGLSVDSGAAATLPLSLTVGAELVADAIGDALPRAAVSVARDGDAAALLRDLTDAGRVGLVAMGDGSARRSTAAPGYLDDRAVPFDDSIAQALRAGDAYALEDVDPAVAAELMVAGAPVWRATASVLRNARFDAELLAYEAPLGVAYFVAAWVTRA